MEQLIFSSSLKRALSSLSSDNDQEYNVLVDILNTIIFNWGPTPRMFLSDEYNYITLRGNNEISFLPKGKEHIVNEDGTRARKNRVNTTIGRFVRKLINIEEYNRFAFANGMPTITDKMVETFVLKLGGRNLSFENLNMDDVISIVNGDDIRDWYHEDCYQMSGNLGNSCMRYERCQKYFDIYTYNKEQVSMLIMVLDGKLQGRSILWHKDGQTYYDRIYFSSPYYLEIIKDYCLEKGWKDVFSLDFVELWTYCFDYYPYMDNMCELDFSTGKLWNHRHTPSNIYTTTLRDTDGGGDDSESMIWSEWHDEEIPEDDAVFSHAMDSYIYANDAAVFTIDERGRTDYAHPDWDGVCYVSYKGEYYHIDLCVRDLDDDAVLLSDATELSSKHYGAEAYTMEPAFEDHDGNMILESDANLLNNNFYGEEDYAHDDDVEKHHQDGYILSIDAVELDDEFYPLQTQAHKDEVVCAIDGAHILLEDAVETQEGYKHKDAIDDEVVHDTKD
jgi:hypothetical protein